MRNPCVYLLASKPLGTLYTGVTSELHARMALHTQKLFEGFTKKYDVTQLVYYEMHDDMNAAIRREKRIKDWKRLWKIRIIEEVNPEWKNLFDPATGEIAFCPAVANRLSAEPVHPSEQFDQKI